MSQIGPWALRSDQQSSDTIISLWQALLDLNSVKHTGISSDFYVQFVHGEISSQLSGQNSRNLKTFRSWTEFIGHSLLAFETCYNWLLKFPLEVHVKFCVTSMAIVLTARSKKVSILKSCNNQHPLRLSCLVRMIEVDRVPESME